MIPGVGMGAWAGAGEELDLYSILKSMDLADNLLFCLDAGAEKSFGGGQVWKDLSPNGADFYLGESATAEGSDPTFSGTIGGLSENEYFQYDGGDWFREVSGGWGDDDIIKADVGMSIFAVTHQPSAASTNGLFTNQASGNSNRNAGIVAYASAADPSIATINASGSVGDVEKSTVADKAGMNFFGIRNIWQANKTIISEFTVNAGQSSASYAAGVPPTGNASAAGYIGRTQVGGSVSAAGTRTYCTALWRGRVISQAQMLAIRARLKELRFPSLVD